MSAWLIAYVSVVVAMAIIGLGIWFFGAVSDETRRFAARIFLLSPLWPVAAVIAIGFTMRALIRDALGEGA